MSDNVNNTSQDVSNYERWRQLYEKVQGMQVQIERLNELIRGLNMSRMGPETELERMRAELKQWEKYYPDVETGWIHRRGGAWIIGEMQFEGCTVGSCRLIFAAIQAAEVERAIETGFGIHRGCRGYDGQAWYITAYRVGKIVYLCENQPSLLAALLELKQWEEKRD